MSHAICTSITGIVILTCTYNLPVSSSLESHNVNVLFFCPYTRGKSDFDHDHRLLIVSLCFWYWYFPFLCLSLCFPSLLLPAQTTSSATSLHHTVVVPFLTTYLTLLTFMLLDRGPSVGLLGKGSVFVEYVSDQTTSCNNLR